MRTLVVARRPDTYELYVRVRNDHPCTFERACSDYGSLYGRFESSAPCDNCQWVEFYMDRLREAMS